MKTALAILVSLAALPLVSSAQYGCGNTKTSQSALCQQTAFGSLDQSKWIVISRHGEYAQSETECNTPNQVAVTNGTLVINTKAQSYTCGDFNVDGSVKDTPASWPYNTGDVQWRTATFQYGTITFRAKYMSSNTNLWPSHWLLSTNCQQTNPMSGDVGFSSCPSTSSASYEELDMIECYNSLSWCSTNVYTGGNGSWHTCHMLPAMDLNWHTYTYTRTSTSVSMKIDNTDSGCTTTSSDYGHFPVGPMFMIIQTQTGGVAGTPSNSNLPASLYTDFVRVQDTTGQVTFYDDFSTPLPAPMLRPLAHLARLAGATLTPGVTSIQGLTRFQGKVVIN